MSSERRRHGRVRTRGVSVRLKTDSSNALCMVGNFSLGGVFVRTTQPLPLGTAVVLELAAPGMRRPLKVPGLVANVSGERGRVDGIGIQFTAGDVASQERIREFLGAVSVAVSPEERDGARSASSARASAPRAGGDPFAGDRFLARSEGRERRSQVAEPAAPPPRPAPVQLRPALPMLPAAPAPALARVLVPEAPPELTSELQALVRTQQEEIARLRAEVAELRTQLAGRPEPRPPHALRPKSPGRG